MDDLSPELSKVEEQTVDEVCLLIVAEELWTAVGTFYWSLLGSHSSFD